LGFTWGMASRERLLDLAARAAELATARRVRVVAQVLLVAALVFAIVRLRSIWHDSHIAFAQIDWFALAGAFVVSLVGVGAGGFIWLSILRRLGVETQRRWAAVFFQAQLAKYIPGTLWQYAGRATLARAQGIPARAVGVSVPIELAALALGAAAMSPLLLGWWGALTVGVLAIAAAGVERLAARSPTVAAGARAWLYYMCVWVPVGLGFWLTARALVVVPAHDLPVYVGAYAIAWLVGFVAVYAPGGLGVREAVLVALLRGRLGIADALAVAAVSRAVVTLVDLVLAGAGFAWANSKRPRFRPTRPIEATDAHARESR
jgi:glycosyltransferase 2 family protein